MRFVVSDHRNLSARPGQFLTFSFLFDRKRIDRSYSIYSSPARLGYVEITTKRVDRGCVSKFLNDHASIGLTVEAKGPFGRFCFHEDKHHDIVLLAAGSGITPMMAMLRYIDDLCLQTTISLIYCVRTRSDIIFEGELEQLRSRLKKRRYRVVLSQPDEEWSGAKGHINQQIIQDSVDDLTIADFSLCGPGPFMDASRSALTALAVHPERIMQESFSGAARKSAGGA